MVADIVQKGIFGKLNDEDGSAYTLNTVK